MYLQYQPVRYGRIRRLSMVRGGETGDTNQKKQQCNRVYGQAMMSTSFGGDNLWKEVEPPPPTAPHIGVRSEGRKEVEVWSIKCVRQTKKVHCA